MQSGSFPLRELRGLHHSLNNAPDSLLAKVVAVVDALERRGNADDVIAPLRPRLAQIRPRRPLRFARLLFLPLDPLIVPSADWRDGSPTIPRAVLMPLVDTVRSALGGTATAIDAMIDGRTTDDEPVAVAAGRVLWPAAARILAGQPADPTGLTPRIAMLLGLTQRLQGLFAEVERGIAPRRDVLVDLLSPAAGLGRDMLTMLLALVLARLPEQRGLLQQIAREFGPDGTELMRSAIDRALAVLVDRLEKRSGVETLVIGSSLRQAGGEVRRIITLLGELPPDPATRLKAIMERLDACCHLRFATALEAEFATTLQASRKEPGHAALAALEQAARGLHELEVEARRIGNHEVYDRLLKQASAMVRKAAGAQAGLGLVDRVRLVEILAGPDEALTMLEEAEPAA